jgi:hypothetical protein
VVEWQRIIKISTKAKSCALRSSRRAHWCGDKRFDVVAEIAWVGYEGWGVC